jgi:fructoselysine-6-P-deglycase FrlB-like protein
MIGCGTSLFIAQAIAVWRESAGHGVTDAFTPSEMPAGRRYDCVMAISRSGTTTEVMRALESLSGTEKFAITATEESPLAKAVDHLVLVPFADETSIVQTRSATTVVALWRAYLGHDIEQLSREAEAKVAADVPAPLTSFEQFVFLGHGPAVGLANEAGLKFREAALAWSEAYPAMELRHGPISVLGPKSLVWSLSTLPDGLAEEVLATGAQLEENGADPLPELVRVHRAAIALALEKGLDPDRPPHLERSVVLQ